MSTATAKTAIAYLCKILRGLNISFLAPDEFRQAKFNGPVGPQLLHTLHALVLLKLCGGFDAERCARASRFMAHLRQHERTSDHLPSEGVLMTKLYLLQWGCPSSLAGALQPACGSRLLLLALGWLVDHCALFDQWHAKLGAEPSLPTLLPALLHDTSTLPRAKHAFASAVSACQQRERHAEACLAQLAPDAAIEASMQHILCLLGKVEKQHKDTSSLTESHIKLTNRIIRLQQPLQHQAPLPVGPTRRPASDPAPEPPPGPNTLTPFEIHLLANPEELQQQHQRVLAALATARAQQECRLQASTFTQWMLSVLQLHLSCQAAKHDSPQLQAAQQHVDPRLLSAPLPALEQEAERLWHLVQQAAAAAPAPSHRAPKPSSSLSMYAPTPPASASRRASKQPHPPPTPPPPLSLGDFTPPHLHAPSDPAAMAAFLQLPADLRRLAAAAQQGQAAVPVEACASSAAQANAGQCRATLQQPLQEPRMQSTPAALASAGAGRARDGAVQADSGGTAAAAAGAQVLVAAKELARSRAAVKRKLLGVLAPVAREEQLVVLGV